MLYIVALPCFSVRGKCSDVLNIIAGACHGAYIALKLKLIVGGYNCVAAEFVLGGELSCGRKLFSRGVVLVKYLGFHLFI